MKTMKRMIVLVFFCLSSDMVLQIMSYFVVIILGLIMYEKTYNQSLKSK